MSLFSKGTILTLAFCFCFFGHHFFHRFHCRAEAHGFNRNVVVVRNGFGFRNRTVFVGPSFVSPSFGFAPSFVPSYVPAYYGPNFVPNVDPGCGVGSNFNARIYYGY